MGFPKYYRVDDVNSYCFTENFSKMPNVFAFFRFWPGISLSAKGCPRPKGPRKPVKLWTTLPDTLVTYFFHFGPPSTGKWRFYVFSPVPGFLQVPTAVLGQMAENPRVSRFPACGGPAGQNVNCKKVADNHPGQLFFPVLGPPAPGNCVSRVFRPGSEFF